MFGTANSRLEGIEESCNLRASDYLVGSLANIGVCVVIIVGVGVGVYVAIVVGI